MSDGDPQSALREWRAHMRHPVTGLALAGAGAVLGIAGPFGTVDLLPLAPRVGYWLLVTGATYGAASLASELVRKRLADGPAALRIGAMGLATGLAVTLVVLVVNYVAFAWLPDLRELPIFVATIFAISVIVTVVISLAHRHLASGPGSVAPETAPAPPPLLDRLPLDKRGALIALSVEDHYVRVRTTRGEELLLMRLSDAIREVGGTDGAQVHRSHWVAFAQVSKARREGDRAILTLTGGLEIPVSRANVPKIKEAGLLPR